MHKGDPNRSPFLFRSHLRSTRMFCGFCKTVLNFNLIFPLITAYLGAYIGRQILSIRLYFSIEFSVIKSRHSLNVSFSNMNSFYTPMNFCILFH